MRTWVKLYTEILRDPKMYQLTDRRFRICVSLFAVAGLIDKNGLLGTLSDIVFHLRMSEETLQKELKELQKVSIVVEKNGVWSMKNWKKRQSKPPSDEPERRNERARKYRKNKAKQSEEERENNEGVTALRGENNALEVEVEVEGEIDTDTDSEESVGADALPTQHALWLICKDIFEIGIEESDPFISKLESFEPPCTPDNARHFSTWFKGTFLKTKTETDKTPATQKQIQEKWKQAFSSNGANAKLDPNSYSGWEAHTHAV